MFGEKVMEASAITGTGAYQVNTGTSGVGSFNAWRAEIGNGKTAFYYAQRGDGTIWEAGWGTLTFGSPDTLSRNLIASSTGSLISWVVGDAPIYVFSAPSATFLAGILSGYVARPAWAPANFRWADITAGVATRIIDKIFNGTADVETGRYEGAPGIYVPSPRRPYIAKGAANYVATANDVGWRISFDTSAAVRTLTLPSVASVGMGYTVEVLGLSASNGVTIAPNGTDIIDFGSAGGSLTIPGQRLVAIWSDGAQWRTNFVASAVSYGNGFVNALRNGSFLSWPNGSSGTTATGASGSAAIAASGWSVIPTGAACTWSSDTGSNGSLNSLKMVGATGVTGIKVAQRVESADAAQLAGKQVTFQATIYNNTGAPISPTLQARYAGSTDNWTSPVVDLAGTALQSCPSGAWTTVAYSFSVNALAAQGYELQLDFANNFSTTGKYVKMCSADIRVTAGATTGLIASPPTPEIRDVASELLRCARYFDASYENGTTPGTATAAGMYHYAMNSGSSQGQGTVKFTAPMRAAPTFAYWDGAGNSSKISSYGNTTTTRSDNLTPNPTPWNASKQSIQIGGDSSGSADKFLHYTAYADFW